MTELLNDKGESIPRKTQTKINDFIKGLKDVPWFSPSAKLKKEEVEKQAKFTLECFGLEAEIEYRKLETKVDWASAIESGRQSNKDSYWVSAKDSDLYPEWASSKARARDLVRDLSWNLASAFALVRFLTTSSARDSASASYWDYDPEYDSASNWTYHWDSVFDSDYTSTEILLEDNKEFKKQYPNGAFKQLFKLWEMGLYPVGVLQESKKFVIYVPPCSLAFPFEI